jgi:hypothetical protein
MPLLSKNLNFHEAGKTVAASCRGRISGAEEKKYMPFTWATWATWATSR